MVTGRVLVVTIVFGDDETWGQTFRSIRFTLRPDDLPDPD